MYASFFGLGEKPFAITPDPRYLFMSERHAEALAHLLYGINEAGGFIELTGEVGTGKTTVVRTLLEQLPGHADVAVILNPRVTPLEFLLAICEELGVFVRDEDESSVKALVDILNRRLLEAHGKGRRVVVIVDEAQNLSPDTLEQVRLLTNLETATQKLLQIILIGQPELRDVLARNELRQLAQRITGRYHLDPLSREETGAYVRHRLRVAGATAEVFSRSALREVYRLSGGIPRLINVICDRALLGAYTQELHRIGPGLVRRAASEVYGRPVGPPWLGWLAAVSGAAAAAVLALGVFQLLDTEREAPIAAAQQQAAPPEATTASVPIEPLAIEGATPDATAAAPSSAATAAVPDATPIEPPLADLDELLREHAPETSTEGAFAHLFALWGGIYEPAAGRACDQAPAQGLECVFQRGSWGQLRALNRPAILTLTDDGGNAHQVVLTRLRDETASLRLGDEDYDVSIASLSRYWYGDSLLLWRPQIRVGRSLAIGTRSEDVRWLRRSLGSAQGQPVPEPPSDYFDQDLAARVEDFQRQHRLTIDGIVGVQTQIVLDTVLNSSGGPVLIERESGS